MHVHVYIYGLTLRTPECLCQFSLLCVVWEDEGLQNKVKTIEWYPTLLYSGTSLIQTPLGQKKLS